MTYLAETKARTVLATIGAWGKRVEYFPCVSSGAGGVVIWSLALVLRWFFPLSLFPWRVKWD